MITKREMVKNGGLHPVAGSSEYMDWYNVIGSSRGSKPLEISNYRVALKLLGGEGENVVVERYRHWAVGWVEEIYVRPNTPEYAIACQIENELMQYPILDEADFYNEEFEAAADVWKSFTWRERIEFIKDHADSFVFKNFKEMLDCVRGKYFCCYPEDLIY